MENCKFAIQFLADSQQIFNTSFERFSFFKKNDIERDRDMLVSFTNKIPEKHYKYIVDLYNDIITNKLEKLLFEVSKDSNVSEFTHKIISKLIANIRFVNKVKFERIMIIIKSGINPTCKDSTMEALVDLEYYLNLLYSHDRRFITEDNRNDFIQKIASLILSKDNLIEKLINDIDLTESVTKRTIDLLNKQKGIDPIKIPGIFIGFSTKVLTTDTPMSATKGSHDIINIINSKINNTFNDKLGIEFSQICITARIIDEEMYIDYYGFTDKTIAGCFSLDFIKLKNIINDNLTYYILYFVLCCYCVIDEQNVFKIDLGIKSHQVKNVFIFLEKQYTDIFLTKIQTIPNKMSYLKILSHIDRFINTILKSDTRKTQNLQDGSV